MSGEQTIRRGQGRASKFRYLHRIGEKMVDLNQRGVWGRARLRLQRLRGNILRPFSQRSGS